MPRGFCVNSLSACVTLWHNRGRTGKIKIPHNRRGNEGLCSYKYLGIRLFICVFIGDGSLDGSLEFLA